MEPSDRLKFDYAALHTEAERRIGAAGVALDDVHLAKIMVDFAIELARRTVDKGAV